jgi:hypothetical protein
MTTHAPIKRRWYVRSASCAATGAALAISLGACGASADSATPASASQSATAAQQPSTQGQPGVQGRQGGPPALSAKARSCLKKAGLSAKPGGNGPPSAAQLKKLRAAMKKCGVTMPNRPPGGQGGPPPQGGSGTPPQQQADPSSSSGAPSTTS